MKSILSIVLFYLMMHPIFATIVQTPITYTDEVVLKGFLVYDDSNTHPRPGVLIIHQWMGITDYELMRAKQFAEAGYIAFIADMYGEDVQIQNTAEAAQESGQFKNNRMLTRNRALAGLNTFRKQPLLKNQPVAAIGYCFGGMVALELARSGAAVAGVVSVHGSLDTPTPNDAGNITGKVLALHGADDPYVSWEDVSNFRKEMQTGHVNWQLNVYGNAVHAFSQKMAGTDPSKGVAYNAQADNRSFKEILNFFKEVFN